MIRANVTIRGIKPFIFHKFNLESITDTRKPREGSAGNNPNEWRDSFFHRNGQLYMPGTYMFASLRNGAVHTKVGRGTIQKTWISAVTVDDEIIVFNRHMFDNWENIEPENIPQDSNLPVYVDIRMVSNPNTKGKNVRYRIAMSPGWECSFSLTIDNSLVSQAQAKKVIEDAGKLQGIADGRTLGYGRFEVVKCDFEPLT